MEKQVNINPKVFYALMVTIAVGVASGVVVANLIIEFFKG